MNRLVAKQNNLSIDAGGAVARVRLNNTGQLEFDYIPERNTYLTIVAELDSEPQHIEWAGPHARASSGEAAKQGDVYGN
jgi:hypothetical protein